MKHQWSEESRAYLEAPHPDPARRDLFEVFLPAGAKGVATLGRLAEAGFLIEPALVPLVASLKKGGYWLLYGPEPTDDA